MPEEQNQNPAPQETAAAETPEQKPKASGMKKPSVFIPAIVVVIFLIGFGYMLFMGEADAPEDATMEEDMQMEEETEPTLEELEEELDSVEFDEMDNEMDEMDEEVNDMEAEME